MYVYLFTAPTVTNKICRNRTSKFHRQSVLIWIYLQDIPKLQKSRQQNPKWAKSPKTHLPKGKWEKLKTSIEIEKIC